MIRGGDGVPPGGRGRRTVAELKGRGVEFTMPIEDHGYGFDVHLYQPRYRKG